MSKKCLPYHYVCDCGHRIEFKSKQPAGAREPAICERCYQIHVFEIPDREGKYLRTMQKNIFNRRMDILRIFNSFQEGMTVRQMFYRMVSQGYEKTESFYDKVQDQLLKMREGGVLPWSFIVDNSRTFYKPNTHSGLKAMLENSKKTYRRALWDNFDVNVEIWLEKVALRGVFLPITRKYDVPLFPSIGFSSATFIWEATEEIKRRSTPTFIYLFGDYDPSGRGIQESIINRMKSFGVEDRVVFEIIALTEEQVQEYDLPERLTKKSTHSKGWSGGSVELDALDPRILRGIVEECITRHIDDYQLQQIQKTEQLEKETLDTIINNMGLV